MKLARLILFVALNACVTVHASETFKIDPARSTIAFKVRHMLGTAQGKFSKFSGTIVVDREHPEQSSVSVKIAAAEHRYRHRETRRTPARVALQRREVSRDHFQ